MADQELTPVQTLVYARMVVPYLQPWWGRRTIGATVIWLPPDMNWPDEDMLPDWFWDRMEANGSKSLWECRCMAAAAIERIEAGRGPVFAFPLVLAEPQFVDNEVVSWIIGEEATADDCWGLVRLPVLALDLAEGWALTLHGLHQFNAESDEPEASDPFAGPRA